MNASGSAAQLHSIATWWPTVFEAHAAAGDAALPARHNLLQRYGEAVHRYLLGAVRDPDVAGDLSQEFAVRLLRGDFRHANPERGRFRDYLRTVLINLVNKHFRDRQRLPRSLAQAASPTVGPADPPSELPFFKNSLRAHVLGKALAALSRVHPLYQEVLQLRAENAELSSAELAEKLTATTGKDWNAAKVRKTLERARTAFVDLLIEQLSTTLKCRGSQDVWDALADLQLLPYCRDRLRRPCA